MFHDRLNEYITRLGCSGRELAEASGLSPATISRYRGGERRPESEAERAKLISGIARLAERRGVPALTEEAVAEGFRPFFPEESFDAEHLRAALNTLLTTSPSASPTWPEAPITTPPTSPASAAASAARRTPSASSPPWRSMCSGAATPRRSGTSWRS